MREKVLFEILGLREKIFLVMNLEMQDMHLDMNQLPNLMNYAKVGFQPFLSFLRSMGQLLRGSEVKHKLWTEIRPFKFQYWTIHFSG